MTQVEKNCQNKWHFALSYQVLYKCFFIGTLQLKTSKTHRDKFERGNCDEFVITAVDLGELRKIK